MSGQRKCQRVLALHLNQRGFAFCVFDGPAVLHDWGVKHVGYGNQTTATLAIVTHLLQRFSPDGVVIEDASALGAMRAHKVRALYREIEARCDEHIIDTYSYAWEAVFKLFTGCCPESRHDIAVQVAQLLPMIKRRLPPKRRYWMPQDPRQSLFDAAALGLTHYAAHPE